VLIHVTIKVSYNKQIRLKSVAMKQCLQQVTQSQRKRWGWHSRGGRAATASGKRPMGDFTTERSCSGTCRLCTAAAAAVATTTRASLSGSSGCWCSTTGRCLSLRRSRHPPSPTASLTTTSASGELEPCDASLDELATLGARSGGGRAPGASSWQRRSGYGCCSSLQ
jgi:hypothetical protein